MRSQPPDSPVDVLRRWSSTPHGGPPPALDLLLDAAGEFHPGTHIGISVVGSEGFLTTLASTSTLVFQLDQLQHELDEGPSLTALGTGHTVIVDDLESEHRWAAFTPRAVALGLSSALVLPLSISDQALGVLNLYSPTHTPLSAQSLDQASAFAAQAAIVVSQAQREQQLLSALQTSRTVGIAIGQVMERFCIDGYEAHAYLSRLSHCSGATLLEIAAEFVQQSNDRWRAGQGGAPTGGAARPHLSVLPPQGGPRTSRT